MTDLGAHNAKESGNGWIRYCSCGGEGWPQIQGKMRLGALIAVECFGTCGAVGPEADTELEAVRLWNEQGIK